jgi:hypothetical protein
MDATDLLHLAVQAAQKLTERHGARLRASESITIVFGRHQGARRVELRLHDPPADRLVELIVDVPDLADDEAVALGLDFLDGALAQHLQGEREALPRLDPAPCQFEGHTLFLHGGVRRPDLEAQADALLAANPEDPEET